MTMRVPQGTWEKGAFAFPIRVYYEDTDVGGMVYHGKYVSFLERIRSESIRGTEADVNHLFELSEEEGGPLTYVVRNINITYHRQAKVDDLLTGYCAVTKLRAAAVEIKQWILNEDGEKVIEAELLVAVINPEGKPRRWSAGSKQAWQNWLNEYEAAQAATNE